MLLTDQTTRERIHQVLLQAYQHPHALRQFPVGYAVLPPGTVSWLCTLEKTLRTHRTGIHLNTEAGLLYVWHGFIGDSFNLRDYTSTAIGETDVTD